MTNSYVLINPQIKGNFNSTVKTKNSLNAAKKLYKNMSKHFNNNVPKFYISIQKGKSGKGKIYHFEIREKKIINSDNDIDVKYSVEPFKFKGETKINKELVDHFSEKNQKGGATKKTKTKKTKPKKTKPKKIIEDDSDSDSEGEFNDTELAVVPVLNHQIYHWIYDPFIYGVKSIYIPTFHNYITPYVEIRTFNNLIFI